MPLLAACAGMSRASFLPCPPCVGKRLCRNLQFFRRRIAILPSRSGLFTRLVPDWFRTGQQSASWGRQASECWAPPGTDVPGSPGLKDHDRGERSPLTSVVVVWFRSPGAQECRMLMQSGGGSPQARSGSEGTYLRWRFRLVANLPPRSRSPSLPAVGPVIARIPGGYRDPPSIFLPGPAGFFSSILRGLVPSTGAVCPALPGWVPRIST